MRRKSPPALLSVAFCLFALTAKTAFGQIGGCVDSPEDATVVLALLGCGALAVPAVRAKLWGSKRSK